MDLIAEGRNNKGQYMTSVNLEDESPYIRTNTESVTIPTQYIESKVEIVNTLGNPKSLKSNQGSEFYPKHAYPVKSQLNKLLTKRDKMK